MSENSEDQPSYKQSLKVVASAPCLQSETVYPSSLFLFFIAVLLLSTGLLFALASLWFIITRYHYTIVLQEPIFNPCDITLVGALISVTCSWLIYCAHNQRSNYVFLPFAIILLLISLLLILSVIIIAVFNRSRIQFNAIHSIQVLIEGPFKRKLNDSLILTMAAYTDEDSIYKRAWDDVQSSLRCCGANNSMDWVDTQHYIPKSCYKHDDLMAHGCIDNIALRLACELNLTAGLSLITVLIQAAAMLLSAYLYKYASSEEQKCERNFL